MLSDFMNYLMNTKLSTVSAKKYESGVRAISKLMLQEGVIIKPLENMNSIEFNSVYISIKQNESFIRKDTVGKNMYKRALDYYKEYLTTKE